MKRKIIGIFVCMLVMTAAAISAAGIMNIATPTKVDKYKTDSIEPESIDKSLIKEEQDDSNPPQPLTIETDYLSVSASAFMPSSSFTDYQKYGRYIVGEGNFVAPVYLRNGATVTKVTFYWSDSSVTWDGYLQLARTPMDQTEVLMADIDTSGSSGNSQSSFDDTIDNAQIDNSQYSYYLWLGLFQSVFCNGVEIEYTYTTSVSSEHMAESQQISVPNVPLSR